MSLTDDYRPKIEEYDLIQAAVPPDDFNGEFGWQKSLRGGGSVKEVFDEIIEEDITPQWNYSIQNIYNILDDIKQMSKNISDIESSIQQRLALFDKEQLKQHRADILRLRQEERQRRLKERDDDSDIDDDDDIDEFEQQLENDLNVLFPIDFNEEEDNEENDNDDDNDLVTVVIEHPLIKQSSLLLAECSGKVEIANSKKDKRKGSSVVEPTSVVTQKAVNKIESMAIIGGKLRDDKLQFIYKLIDLVDVIYLSGEVSRMRGVKLVIPSDLNVGDELIESIDTLQYNNSVSFGESTVEWYSRIIDSDGEYSGDLANAGIVSYVNRDSKLFTKIISLIPDSHLIDGFIRRVSSDNEDEWIFNGPPPPEKDDDEDD
eukprot:gene16895-22384_t